MPTSPLKCTCSMPKVGAIIAAFLKERSFACVAISFLRTTGRVVMVDDGPAEMTAFLTESDGVQVVWQPKHFGKARVLFTGSNVAPEGLRATARLERNAQHHVMDRPTILDQIPTALIDVVIGSRFLDVRNFDSMISLMARCRPLLCLSPPGTLGAALGLPLGAEGLPFHTREVQMLVSVLITGVLLTAVTGVMLQSVQNLAAQLDVEFREAIRALALEGGRQRPSA